MDIQLATCVMIVYDSAKSAQTRMVIQVSSVDQKVGNISNAKSAGRRILIRLGWQ